MRFSLDEILGYTRAQVLNPEVIKDLKGHVFKAITWDSREVEAGGVYLCLQGQRVDGHSFVPAALDAKAKLILVEHDLDVAVLAKATQASCVIAKVENSQEAFIDLAGAWRKCLKAFVIGLTGSVGKTTTKNLIRDVLSYRFKVQATLANQNNELGVPRTILSCKPDTEVLVVEMGMRGSGQIASLVDYVCPDAAVITTIGESHIELLGSKLAIAQAKAEICEQLAGDESFVVINTQDGFGPHIIAQAKLEERSVEVLGFGTGDETCSEEELAGYDRLLWAEKLELDDYGYVSFELRLDGQTQHCQLPIRGYHNAANACACAWCALKLGMTLSDIAQAFNRVQTEQGRFELLEAAAGFTVVNDAYNANPSSMKASVTLVSQMATEGKRIAVLGDMGELGSFASAGHREVGLSIDPEKIAELVCVGSLAQGIGVAAQETGFDYKHIHYVADANEAFDCVRELASAQDLILVKASHSVGLDVLSRRLVEA